MTFLAPWIARFERMAARHWQAAEQSALGDWLLRASSGFTGRANSALPLGEPGVPLDEAVDAVRDWYRERGLPPMIQLPMMLNGEAADQPDNDPRGPGYPLDELLATRGWRVRPGPAVVMTARSRAVADRAASGNPPLTGGVPAGGVPAGGVPIGGAPTGGAPMDAVRLAEEPDEQWLGRYRYRGAALPPSARALLLSAPEQVFASVRRGDETVAIGRLSLAGGWGGLTAIEVDPGCRRSGLGTAVTAALAGEAARRGAEQTFLQVEEPNVAARALYRRCGFRDRHRYHYRVAPGCR